MPAEKILHYLAYGSNLHVQRLRERVPSCEALGPVALPGFRLRFHKLGRDGSGKCNLIHTGGKQDCAYGVLYKLAAREKPLLDAAEQGYRTVWPALALPPGRPGPVFTYVAQPGQIRAGLRPFTWYKDLVLAGACHHCLPARYVAEIRATPAVPDPDRRRRHRHLFLLAAL